MRRLIPQCAVCHFKVGIICQRSAQMLRVTKPALLRLRKKHGHVTDQKRNGVARKNTSPRCSLQKRRRAFIRTLARRVRLIESVPQIVMDEYQREVKKIQKIEVQWHQHPKVAIAINVRNSLRRRWSDPAYKALFYARKRVTEFCKLRNNTKTFSVSKMIGCSAAELRQHLESKFRDGMTWANHGTYWEIDHIVPLASASTIEQIKALCHWSNLQPLTVVENRSKSDKVGVLWEVKQNKGKLPKSENLSSKPQIWLPTLAQFNGDELLAIEPCLGEGATIKTSYK